MTFFYMPATKILMTGNCVQDEIWTLPHYPFEDEELRAESRHLALGGNACNSAQILAQLGDQVSFAGSFASDDSACWMLDTLRQMGISIRYCYRIEGTQSPKSVIWLNTQNGSRTIVHQRTLPELASADITAIDFSRFQWLHIEGRNISTWLEVLPQLALTYPVSLELEKPRKGIESLLKRVDHVMVSKAYLAARDYKAAQCIDEFQRINPALHIVCTLGERGVMAANSSHPAFSQAALKIDPVVDSIGAGDCFIAGYIHQFLQSADFCLAVNFANRLAASKIGHRGMIIDV